MRIRSCVGRVLLAGGILFAAWGCASKAPRPLPPPPPLVPPPDAVGGSGALELERLPRWSDAAALQKPCLSDGSLTFGQIHDRLEAMLRARGYAPPDDGIATLGWFITRTGFGVATRFESLDEQDRARPDRWKTGPVRQSFWDVLKGGVAPGRYRAFVFIYGSPLREEAARTMNDFGLDVASTGTAMPPSIRGQRGDGDAQIQLILYEYERPAIARPPQLVRNTQVRVADHLAKAGLTAPLARICAAR